MSLVKCHPVHHFLEHANDFDRLINNFFHTDRLISNDGINLFPATNIKETSDDYHISLELPGIDKEELKVSIENNILTVSAEKNCDKTNDEATYHFLERRFGTFKRSIPVPGRVKTNGIDARYEDGVLNIRVPKAEKVKPKQISVQVK